MNITNSTTGMKIYDENQNNRTALTLKHNKNPKTTDTETFHDGFISATSLEYVSAGKIRNKT